MIMDHPSVSSPAGVSSLAPAALPESRPAPGSPAFYPSAPPCGKKGRLRWQRVPPAVIRKVRELAAQKLSASQIGEKIGKTRNAIIGICARNGIQLNGKKRAGPTATARKISRERVRALAGEGWIAAEIARAIGCHDTTIRNICAKEGIEIRVVRDRARSAALSKDNQSQLAAKAVSRNTDHAPHDPVGCKYITGDPRNAEWYYCNHKQTSGSSYCATHHIRCYGEIKSPAPRDHYHTQKVTARKKYYSGLAASRKRENVIVARLEEVGR